MVAIAVMVDGCRLHSRVLVAVETVDGPDCELAKSGDQPEGRGDTGHDRHIKWFCFVKVV